MNALDLVHIESHLFTHVRVVAIASFDPETDVDIAESVKTELNIVHHKSATNRYLARLRVIFNKESDPKYPYTIDVGCMAEITVHDENHSEKQKLVARAAHDILLPAIREMILSITARQPWGQLSIGLSELNINEPDKSRSGDAVATTKPTAKKTIRRKASAKAA